jgi:hypothetical protein
VKTRKRGVAVLTDGLVANSLGGSIASALELELSLRKNGVELLCQTFRRH